MQKLLYQPEETEQAKGCQGGMVAAQLSFPVVLAKVVVFFCVLVFFHFFEKYDCDSFKDCEDSFKCGKDDCQGPFSRMDKISARTRLLLDKIAARTSATEAEAAAAKNIPVGKVKETATAIPLRKKQLREGNNFYGRRGLLFCQVRWWKWRRWMLL